MPEQFRARQSLTQSALDRAACLQGTMQMPRLVQVWASLKAATAALRWSKQHFCFSPSHTRGSVNRSACICLPPTQDSGWFPYTLARAGHVGVQLPDDPDCQGIKQVRVQIQM